ATLGQLAGAWIQLKWSSPVSVSKVILYDRPNLTDNVKSGTLLFSDGTSLSVGQLPNDAKTGYTVTFATKTISWVKFTVGSAVGQNTGMAEFEVIAAGSSGGPVVSGLSLNPTTVIGGTSSRGAVTLSTAAPAGGAVVSLSD